MDERLLDNITWHTLCGPHRRFSAGTHLARRYAPGFSPILGFADRALPAFEALRDFCADGEHFYCEGWSGPVPSGWQIELEASTVKMVWNAAMPEADPAPEARRLVAADARDALELVALTRPGPFGIRTLELGEYFGLHEDGQLVAMAGERMHAGSLREISGVCTRPDRQGRGLARRLIAKLVHRQMARGETPFLQAMSGNIDARRMYERLGFRSRHEGVLRVVAPLS